VSTHEQVTVTRNGKPAVVVLSVEEFEALLETPAIAAAAPPSGASAPQRPHPHQAEPEIRSSRIQSVI
jgi:Antitoxin Phd_YefM, type II toxin-antitoxin system